MRAPPLRAPRDDLFKVEPVMPIPPGPPALERGMPNGSFEKQVTGETTLFVSNLPNAADHKVRFLLEQLTGPMVNFKREGPDGWLKYENMECARITHDILREHRIEGIRLVVEIVGENSQSSGQRPLQPIRRAPQFGGQLRPTAWSQKLQITDGTVSGGGGGGGIGGGGGMWGGKREVMEPSSLKRPRSGDSDGFQRKVFVGNFSFETSKIDLHMVFSKYGPIEQIYIPMKEGKSSGFGFIVFSTHEDASRATRMMNGCVLGGRRLRVELSTAKLKEASGSNKKPHVDSNAGGTSSQRGAYNQRAYNVNTPFSDKPMFSGPSKRMQGYGRQ